MVVDLNQHPHEIDRPMTHGIMRSGPFYRIDPSTLLKFPMLPYKY